METKQTVVVSVPYKKGTISVAVEVGELDATISVNMQAVVFINGCTVPVDAMHVDLS